MPHEKSTFGFFTKPPLLEVFTTLQLDHIFAHLPFAKRTEVAIMCRLRQIFHEAMCGVAVVLVERFGPSPHVVKAVQLDTIVAMQE